MRTGKSGIGRVWDLLLWDERRRDAHRLVDWPEVPQLSPPRTASGEAGARNGTFF